MKTIREQIASFEAKRAASAARMSDIMQKAADEGRTLEDAEKEEYGTLDGEVKKIDEHIALLKQHEQRQLAQATPVTPETGGDPAKASPARSGIISVRSNAPKGAAFTRYVCALVVARGNKSDAIEWARRWRDSTPEVEIALKAARAPGSTTDTDFAAPLVVAQNLASEFIDVLRGATLVGRIAGFRRVPFNVSIPRKTAGSVVGWVGEGKPKPVSEIAFDSITLGYAKIAGIVVITEELARLSTPSAEALVQADLVDSISAFMDQQFIDPSVAAVANVHPASVTNVGITHVDSSGATLANVTTDLAALMGKFVTANIGLAGGVFLMHPRTALSLSLLRTTQEVLAFPGISPTGGTLQGLPVITSSNMPMSASNKTIIVLMSPNDILLADDGGVSIDISREATLQMDSAPTTTTAAGVSLWQENLVGVRAERWINYLKRRAAAVQYIDAVTY